MNGAVATQEFTITVGRRNKIPVITSDGGSDTATVSAAENQVEVTTVTATDANNIFANIEGNATYSQSHVLPAGSYALEMKDSYGDGWNGAFFTIASLGISFTAAHQLFEGTAITETVPFIIDTPGTYIIAVSEGEYPNGVSWTLSASNDQTEILTYSLSGGTDQALFEIHENTGALTFKNAPNFESPASDDGDNNYEITIAVSDGELSDQQEITVSVTDVDEGPTDIALTNAVTSLPEDADTSSATKMGDILITDADGGTNTVTLSGDDDASFEVVGSELRLRADVTFDYETKNRYSVTLTTGSVSVDHTLWITNVTPVADCVELNAAHTAMVESGTVPVDGLTSDVLAYALTGSASVEFNPENLNIPANFDAFTLSFWVKLSASSSQPILQVEAGRGEAIFETAPDRSTEIWYSLGAGLGDSFDGQVFEEGAWTHIALHLSNGHGMHTYTHGRPSLVYAERVGPEAQPIERVRFIAMDTSATIELSNIKICSGPLLRTSVRADLSAISAQVEALSSSSLEAVLTSLEDHYLGAQLLDPPALGTLVDVLSEPLFNLEFDPALIQRAADLVQRFESQEGPFFVEPKGDFSREDVGELEWAMFLLQQGVADYGFTHEVQSFPNTSFKTSAHFPGSVGDGVPRVINKVVPLLADNILPAAYHIHQDAKDVVQMTGLYVAPGETVSITAPPEAVGQGIEVRVGAHDEQYDIWQTQQRFPRVLTRFALDAETIEVANPFGGNLLVLIPVGLDLGVMDITVSGAVEAPHYFKSTTRETPLSTWLALRDAEVPWARISGQNFMFSIPTSMVQELDDPRPTVEAWDLAMDGYMELFSRPTTRHRAEYFIADVRNPAGAFGPGYPTIMGGYEPGMEDAGWNPLNIVDPEKIRPSASYLFIVLEAR